VETDRAFLAEIEADCPFDLYEDEFVHKAEHSIELQIIFLRALWQRQDLFQIVPVLCGSLHEAILNNKSPMELPGVSHFIAALKMAMTKSQKRICLLASADLAHVGLRFGDPEAPNRFSLQSLADEDRSLLGFAEGVDAEGFYETIRREKDRRRICGLSSIYTFLHLIGNRAREGKLLNYGQSMDAGNQSAVTFASLAFFR
jgi:AmmeMemoRadiSam system protein B